MSRLEMIDFIFFNQLGLEPFSMPLSVSVDMYTLQSTPRMGMVGMVSREILKCVFNPLTAQIVEHSCPSSTLSPISTTIGECGNTLAVRSVVDLYNTYGSDYTLWSEAVVLALGYSRRRMVKWKWHQLLLWFWHSIDIAVEFESSFPPESEQNENMVHVGEIDPMLVEYSLYKHGVSSALTYMIGGVRLVQC
jgi:hypothetical protein